MAHYAVQMKDGTITVMQTVGDATASECVAKWKNASAVVRCVPIKPEDIPADRAKRTVADWRLDGS